MSELNQAAFSRLAGVTKGAITKALKKKQLILNGSKKIDPENKLSIKYISKQKVKNRTPVEKKAAAVNRGEKLTEKIQPKETTSKKPKPKQKTILSSKPTVQQQPNSIDISDNALNFMDKDELSAIKLAEQIRMERIKQAKLRGELIDREFVEKLFNKIYSIDVNEFLQLSTSITTNMSVIFKIKDKKKLMEATESITKSLYKTQLHIQREIQEFINDMNKARI